MVKNKSKSYIPRKGDLIWINFNPTSGVEQKGLRPALVVSEMAFNDKVGMAFCCPVTNTVRGGPFEVLVPKKSGVSGVILTDQIRSIDWRAREARFISSASINVMNDVVDRLAAILGIS